MSELSTTAKAARSKLRRMASEVVEIVSSCRPALDDIEKMIRSSRNSSSRRALLREFRYFSHLVGLFSNGYKLRNQDDEERHDAITNNKWLDEKLFDSPWVTRRRLVDAALNCSPTKVDGDEALKGIEGIEKVADDEGQIRNNG